MDAPLSLEVFKDRLDGVLSNLAQLKKLLLMVERIKLGSF